MVDGLTRLDGIDPANRVGEVKARLEVFRYVYDSSSCRRSRPDTGFSDPLLTVALRHAVIGDRLPAMRG